MHTLKQYTMYTFKQYFTLMYTLKQYTLMYIL